MLNTFVIYVEDKPGVLARVAILFRRRAFNIETLTVGRTEHPGISRMTIVLDTDERGARRIEANLYKLVNVLWIQNVTNSCVTSDLALLKVAVTAERRGELFEIAKKYDAHVVEEGADALILEISGDGEKIGGFIAGLRSFHVLEMVRTGSIAMTRCGQGFPAKNFIPSLKQQAENGPLGVSRPI
ncbi:MAG TPA: acetolactate synthase small subunit [Terriglobales bacterium]